MTSGLSRAAFLLIFGLAVPAAAEQPVYKTAVTPLLAASETVLGQPLVYPAGKAKVTSAIITIPPGGETGWHSHAVPLYGYILDGELTVDYGSKGLKVYKTGDSLLEAVDWPHDGTNKGNAPVRILAVYMGAEGIDNATAASGAQ